MQEPNVTASTIISFSEKLEEDSSRFYKELAKRRVETKGVFLSFAKESQTNKVLVTRTYQETISDAFEACFSFKGLSLDDYKVKITLTKDTSRIEALKMAVELEKKAGAFYLDAAGRSKSLLATIPQAFRKIAERRNARKLKLELLLEKFT